MKNKSEEYMTNDYINKETIYMCSNWFKKNNVTGTYNRRYQTAYIKCEII